MNKTTYIGGALAVALGLMASGAMAQDKCGLGNGKKASGDPIQIGAIVGKTGPEDFSPSARAAQAYFNCVNANGGINGRPVQYTVQDDTWNPEVASQAANKLVKDTKVVAMVGSSSFVECGVNEALYEEKGVVAVYGTGVPKECFFAKQLLPHSTRPSHTQLPVLGMLCERQTMVLSP